MIDATDDPAAKFLINDICVALERPFVYGGVLGMTRPGDDGIAGAHRVPAMPVRGSRRDEAEIASCREAGIIGPVAAVIGEIEAAEALRWLRGGDAGARGQNADLRRDRERANPPDSK